MAGGHVLQPGGGAAQHDLCRVLPRAQRPLLGHVARLRRPRSTTRRCTRCPTRPARTASTPTAPPAASPRTAGTRPTTGSTCCSRRPAPPGVPTGVQATAGLGAATVSWTAPRRWRPGHELHGHAVHRRRGADAGDGHRHPAGDERQDRRAHRRRELHLRRASGQPQRQQRRLGAVERGRPLRRRRAGRADGRRRPRRPPARRASTGRAPEENGGSAITGYTITPYDGATALAPVSVGAVTTTTITGLANGTRYTLPGRGAQQRRHRRGVRLVQRGHAREHDLRARRSRRSSTPTTRLRSRSASSSARTSRARSAGSASTRPPPTPAPTARTCGRPPGRSLATATSSGETASGWQQIEFATPVSIAAGTTYVASYFAPNGHYSATGAASAPPAPTTRRCTRWPTASAPNAVYAYSSTSTFPTSTWNATNYWVDVLFRPGS